MIINLIGLAWHVVWYIYYMCVVEWTGHDRETDKEHGSFFCWGWLASAILGVRCVAKIYGWNTVVSLFEIAHKIGTELFCLFATEGGLYDILFGDYMQKLWKSKLRRALGRYYQEVGRNQRDVWDSCRSRCKIGRF